MTLEKGLGNIVAFIEDRSELSTAAHEIAHTYGIYDNYRDANGNCCVSNRASPTGLWVNSNFQDLSGASDYMSIGTRLWTTDQNFATLLKNFASAVPDPEVLLVTGTIFHDGGATIDKIYKSDNGFPTPGAGANADGTLQILSSTGAVVSSAKVDTTVTFADVGPDAATYPVPFTFALPFPAGAFQVELRRSGQVLASVNVGSKLLYDAIVSIPASGFDTNPDERRNALLNKVSAINLDMGAKNLNGVVNQLKNDLRKQLDNWLRDGYTVQSRLQYTKPQILALVDELIQRFSTN